MEMEIPSDQISMEINQANKRTFVVWIFQLYCVDFK